MGKVARKGQVREVRFEGAIWVGVDVRAATGIMDTVDEELEEFLKWRIF